MQIRSILASAVCAIALATGVAAQTANPAPETAAVAGPRLVCDNPTFDFGQKGDTNVLTHVFNLRNAGTTPVLVRKVNPGCGCVVVDLSARRILPGQTATLKVKLALKGMRGKFRKAVLVESNDSTGPYCRLWMTGEVTAELALDPARLSLGAITTDAEVTRKISMIARRNDVSITNVTGRVAGLSLERVVVDGVCTQLVVRTVPPLPPGYLRGTFRVHTDHPCVTNIELSVVASVQGEVWVLPKKVVLRGSRPGSFSRTILVVRPGSVKDYRIVDVQVPAEGAVVSTNWLGAGTCRIDIRKLAVSADLNGKEIVILTDLKHMNEIRVPIEIVP